MIKTIPVCRVQREGCAVDLSIPFDELSRWHGRTLDEKCQAAKAELMAKGTVEVVRVLDAVAHAVAALEAAEVAFEQLAVTEAETSEALSRAVGGALVRISAVCGERQRVVTAALGASNGEWKHT